MKILVIGSGGREHALTWALSNSFKVSSLWCAPGNPGMAEETFSYNGRTVSCVPIEVTDILGLRNFAKQMEVDLTIVGPEVPLSLGIADIFKVARLTIFAPGKAAARFESSKCFAQEFARRHKLPFAPGECFSDSAEAKAFARSLVGRCVVKADGLCAGKGAFVCGLVSEADTAIENLLIKRELGAVGKRIVIQERLDGFELSLHVLCDGSTWKLLPSAQDYKRLLNGNKGSLTGGMGAYSPHFRLSLKEVESMAEAVMTPFLKGCRAESITYRGLLYPGIMMTKDGPKILEFNVRFGDPETQVIVPRIKTDLCELLLATAEGRLNEVSLEVHDNRAVCVVIAAPGYPKNPILGKKIIGLEKLGNSPGRKIFYAGVRRDGRNLVTAGGRVVGVTAWGSDIVELRHGVYRFESQIQIVGGKHSRTDIGIELISSPPVA